MAVNCSINLIVYVLFNKTIRLVIRELLKIPSDSNAAVAISIPIGTGYRMDTWSNANGAEQWRCAMVNDWLNVNMRTNPFEKNSFDRFENQMQIKILVTFTLRNFIFLANENGQKTLFFGRRLHVATNCLFIVWYCNNCYIFIICEKFFYQPDLTEIMDNGQLHRIVGLDVTCNWGLAAIVWSLRFQSRLVICLLLLLVFLVDHILRSCL